MLIGGCSRHAKMAGQGLTHQLPDFTIRELPSTQADGIGGLFRVL